MSVGTMDPMVAVERLVAQKKALEVELEQEKRSNAELRIERDAAVGDIKELLIFKPILEQKVVSQQIWLRDKPLILMLKAQISKWYGPRGDMASPDSTVAKSAKHLMDLVVEECVRYAILLQPHIIKMRLDGPLRPSKGDASGDTKE